MEKNKPLNYLTMDLEIYDTIKKDKKNWDNYIENSTKMAEHIFEKLNKNNIKITCFVTDDFVVNYYDLFHKKIVNHHEISCHTHNHFYFNGKNKQNFFKSIASNKEFLEKEIGYKCLGFRSPGAFVPNDLVKFLIRNDFRYDSSVLPGIIPTRHFKISAPKDIYHPSDNNIFKIDDKQKLLVEIPLSVSPKLRISQNGFFFPYVFNLEKAFNSNQRNIISIHISDFLYPRFKSYIWDYLKRPDKTLYLFNKIVKESINKNLRLVTLI